MTWMSLGSLALPQSLNRHSVALRQDLARHTQELTKGEATSIPRHLRGDLMPLLAIDHRAIRLDAARGVARLALTEAETAQTALAGLASLAAGDSARLLAVSTAGADDATLRTATRAARQSFDAAVGILAAEVAGRSLFSGTRPDTAPLPEPEGMIAALRGLVSGAPSAEAVRATLTAAMQDPAGLFATSFYLGGDAAPGAVIDGADRAVDLPTASDPALRQLLGGLAMAALAGDPALGLPDDQRRALTRIAALELSGGAHAVTALQARLGDGEARLADLSERLEGELSALSLARDSLVGIDPYEAAGHLQQVETRLEMLYAVTARTARLSLAGYLR